MTFKNRLALLLALILTATAGSPAGAAPAEHNLPELGDESGAALSPRDERRLGEDFMREAYARLDLQKDPELDEYVLRLGRRVAKAVPDGASFKFFIVNDSSINAFAVPGGFVGIHSGLLLGARKESEVAAVLAHETAHIAQRHIPRLLSASQRMSGPALAAILAGLLLAASGQGGGEAAIALATAGLAQAQINFTRSYEQEADRIGMGFLDSAGFDARAMPAFFERMDALNRLHDTKLPEFLRTHPVTATRLAESLDHAESFPLRKEPESGDFAHMQARLRVLTSNPKAALAYFRANAAPNLKRAPRATRYGYALALLALRQMEAAKPVISDLVAADPDYLPYQLLRADLDLESGKISGSLERYAQAYRRHPASSAAALRFARALLKGNRAEEARQVLDSATRKHPDDPEFFRLLAQAAGEAGRPLEAHRAFGEFYFRTGQPLAAVEQLDIARRYAKDSFYYQSSLDARIREIKESSNLLFKEPRDARSKPKQPLNLGSHAVFPLELP